MRDDNPADSEEKTRICPHCRMEISFWATKCRYCGEMVGRPKDEVRKLTISDLGGEHGSDYAPSEEVAGALEAFRKAEMARLGEHPAPPRRWFWRGRRVKEPGAPSASLRSAPGSAKRDNDTLPTSGFTVARRAPPPGPSAMTQAARAGAVVLAAGVLVVAAVFLGPRLREYFRPRATPPPYVENRALELLNSPGNLLTALRVARETLTAADTEQNREVLQRVRQRVTEEIQALLNSSSFDKTVLSKASALVSEAGQIDPNSPEIRELLDIVTNEVYAYTMTIVRVDNSAGRPEVVLRVVYRNGESERVLKSKGERVHGRFEIMSIAGNSVRFKDWNRAPGGVPREFYLYEDGTFSSVPSS